ncbi:hypothetical protein [Albibacterium profundi]|uniref:Uncharacterized protein n=1 Tax=Albibacterium profundi TaxID=3134906 RepID=A0ABV5CE58_9SPHI
MRERSILNLSGFFPSLVQDLFYMFPWSLADTSVTLVFKRLFERGPFGETKKAALKNLKGGSLELSLIFFYY